MVLSDHIQGIEKRPVHGIFKLLTWYRLRPVHGIVRLYTLYEDRRSFPFLLSKVRCCGRHPPEESSHRSSHLGTAQIRGLSSLLVAFNK